MKVLFRGKKYADLSDLVEDLHVRFGYELKDDVVELLEISGIEPQRAPSDNGYDRTVTKRGVFSSDYTGGRWSLK